MFPSSPVFHVLQYPPGVTREEPEPVQKGLWPQVVVVVHEKHVSERDPVEPLPLSGRAQCKRDRLRLDNRRWCQMNGRRGASQQRGRSKHWSNTGQALVKHASSPRRACSRAPVPRSMSRRKLA